MPHMYGIDDAGAKWVAKASDVAQKVLAPNAPQADAKAQFPSESIAALGANGFLGMCVPAAMGGGGQGFRTFVAVAEELAQGCGSTAIIYAMHVIAQQVITASATLKDKAGVLKDICAGKHLTQLAFSERGARSAFYAPVSQLVAAPSGFTVSAHKSFITGAHNAQSYVALSRMPGAKAPVETTAYLVRMPKAGVKPIGAFQGLGFRANDSVPVDFENVAIPADDLLSAHGDGFRTLMEVALPWVTTGTAAVGLGIAQAAFGMTAKHITETGYEGAPPPGALGSQKLRDLPNERQRLAQMATRANQARALLGYALGELEHPSPMTPLYLLQARAGALDAALDVTDQAMRVWGGAAISRPGAMERIFRDARAAYSVAGPTGDHSYELIGRALTGLPLL